MATSKPVDLCTQLLSSGKLCRGIALKNERFCRAHIRNHRIAERDRQHQEAMDRLGAQLDVLDLPELLLALHEKLNRIRSIVRAYPEARLALIITINRLARLTSLESGEAAEAPQNQEFLNLNPAQLNQFRQMLASLPESNT
jgi:hypothetical protein